MLRSISPRRNTNVAPTDATSSGAKKRAMLPRLAPLVKPSTVRQKTAEVATSTGSIGASWTSRAAALQAPRAAAARVAVRRSSASPPSFVDMPPIPPRQPPAGARGAVSPGRRAQAAQPQIWGATLATSSGP